METIQRKHPLSLWSWILVIRRIFWTTKIVILTLIEKHHLKGFLCNFKVDGKNPCPPNHTTLESMCSVLSFILENYLRAKYMELFFSVFYFYNLFILGLYWVLFAAQALCLAVVSRTTLWLQCTGSHWSGFSCCRAQVQGHTASVIAALRLRSCSFRALKHNLNSCGTWAYLLPAM